MTLSGCIALGGIDRTAGTVDRSIGAARNNSILLNIVRASRNEPLYFYSVSKFTGSGTEDFKLSLPPFTLGPHQTLAQKTYTFGTAGLNLLDSNQAGNFDLAPLDSRNFFQGMLAPLGLAEVDLLLRQGFPRQLVYRLAVQDVLVYDDKGLHRYVNDPRSPTYASLDPANPGFQFYFAAAMAAGVSTEGFSLQPTPGGSAGEAAVKVEADARTAINSNPSATSAHVRLCLDPTLSAPRPGVESDREASNDTCGERSPNPAPTANLSTATLKQTFTACTAALQKLGEPKTAADPEKAPSNQAANQVCTVLNGRVLAVQLDTRSLFAIFRYLGELLREETPGGVQLNLAMGARDLPSEGLLLNIVKERTENCFTAIDYHGHYCVPNEHSDNLLTTFSIINSLQALKTAPGDLPVTPTVRIEQ